MSDTYIGPFGRILPVADKPETPPLERTDHRMIAQQPRLPLPTRLNFGSDPRPGFTDPARYDNWSRQRSTTAPTSASTQERLPGVDQLLTPASPTPPTHGNRAPQPEPLTPGEARARHLYGWSKSGLEALATPREPSRASYFPRSEAGPAQSPSSTVFPGPGYGQYPSPHSSAVGLPTSQYATSGTLSQYGVRPGDPYSPNIPYGAGRNGVPYSALGGGSINSPVAAATKPVPKLLGEQIFPGEGTCYVYDDGSHVRKTIDGEQVNAQWGITKAGKPRKRLALACLTCREKKIKCDPAEPKCVQCEKSGRECRFASARASRRQ